jgi:hypothetical protein
VVKTAIICYNGGKHMRKKHSHKKTALKRVLRQEIALMLFCLLCTAWTLGVSETRASVETVCITVTVIGPDGGDPGTGDCSSGGEASSSASSAASSSSSSSDSSSSAESSSSEAGSSSSVDDSGGGSRGSSSWRIILLLRRWAEQGHLRPAPPESPSEAPPEEAPCILFSDVPENSWYAEAVCDFLRLEYLDITQPRFRPNSFALRAEMAQLLVIMNKGTVYIPDEPAFNDVSPNSWYYGAVETAARKEWMLGYDNCYGTKPCFARSSSIISRAEAAALVVRYFEFEPLGLAPAGSDVHAHAWYAPVLQAASDHCVILGDEHTANMRPADPVSRAEMVMMLWRGMKNLRYGTDCTMGTSSTEYRRMSLLKSVPLIFSLEMQEVESLKTDVYECGLSVTRCIASAIAEDIRTLSGAFYGSASVTSAKNQVLPQTSETVIWAVGTLWAALILRFVFRISHVLKQAFSAVR